MGLRVGACDLFRLIGAYVMQVVCGVRGFCCWCFDLLVGELVVVALFVVLFCCDVGLFVILLIVLVFC